MTDDIKDKKLDEKELDKVNGGIVLGKAISAHGIDSYYPGTILAYADSIDGYVPHLVKLCEINGVAIKVKAMGFASRIWFNHYYCRWYLLSHEGSADITLVDSGNDIYIIGYDIFSSNKFYEVESTNEADWQMHEHPDYY